MLVGRAVHHFIRDLTEKCAEVSMKRGKTGQCMNYKLTKENIREAIYSNPRFAFLKKVVEEIPMETEQD